MNEIKIYIKITLIFFASIVSTNIVTASDISDKNISNEKIIEKSKISFEEQVYDFGKIYIGESVKHAFKLKNLGKGELIEEVSVNPKRINFGIIRKGDSCTKNMEIKTVQELKIDIKKVESPSPYITIIKNQTDENYYAYQVTISKYDYIGKFNGIVFIYTSSSKQERIDVPFSGEIVGHLTFYPEVLSFGSVKLGQDVKKTVIVNFINKDVKIEKIED